MNHLIRSALVLASAAGLAAARPPRPTAAASSLTMVVTGGPYAGTYQARADRILCFYAKDADRYGATFRDEKANTPRSLVAGGIVVVRPYAAGAKIGDLHVTFGTDAKNSISYDVDDVPVTMTLKGKGADLAGVAKTKDGVSLHITASCTKTDAV
jgi:hypothetical protein